MLVDAGSAPAGNVVNAIAPAERRAVRKIREIEVIDFVKLEVEECLFQVRARAPRRHG